MTEARTVIEVLGIDGSNGVTNLGQDDTVISGYVLDGDVQGILEYIELSVEGFDAGETRWLEENGALRLADVENGGYYQVRAVLELRIPAE